MEGLERVFLYANAHRIFSAMLFGVRKYFLLLTLLVATGFLPLAATQSTQQPNQAAPQTAAPATSVPHGPQNPAPAVAPSGPVIVLNPAHGGTDTGARGANNLFEKDIVLQFARMVRVELVRDGYRVVMTRDDDANPSYEDRAGMANGYRDSIFISIHVSSTGNTGTARAYYYRFSTSLVRPPSPVAPMSMQTPAPMGAPAPSALNLTPWADAQRPYVNASRHFADILQGELAQRFSGSPAASSGVAIRGLQSVSAPAIAVEISSISVTDLSSLLALGGPLATSIARAVQTFRPSISPETR